MKTKYFYLLLFLFLFTSNLFSQTGVVKGKVYDAVNNEPLAFVNVVVSGTSIGATSDLDGNYIITGLEPGIIRISASFVGYEQALSPEIRVTNANPTFIDIALKQADQKVEEVVINASPFKRTQESPVSLRAIGFSEIENSPGANRDITKVIQSFPGVASSVSFRNDIIIRGGGPSESRFYLDNVEVPNINHFATQGASGGPVGILNADFIREVNFYSGAFPSSKGNALSGVFDFKQIDGNTDKLKFKGTVGASELAGTIDGPIGNKTSFILSARQSYLQFLFNAIGLPFLPTFNDFQVKVKTKLSIRNELTFIGLGAIDKFALNTGIKNPDETQRFILSYLPVNNQWNYTVGAVYKHFENKSYHTFVVSRNHLHNSSYKYYENDDSSPDNKILDYESQEIENKLRYENTYASPFIKLNYGANAELARYTNNTFQKRFSGNQLITLNYNTDLDIIKYGLFGQVSKDFLGTRLSLSLGLRTDANNYSSSMSNIIDQLSPRFSASYYINDNFSISFNTGRYFQLPAYTSLGFKLNDEFVNKKKDLKYISVNHLIGGFEYRPNDFTQISVEGFYKGYNNYPYSVKDSISIANKGADFGVIGDEEVTSTSKGRATGVEFQTRLKTRFGFNFNLSYTFVRSEFEDRKGKYVPSSWDNRHIISITSTKNFKNNWKAGLKWRFLGGAPYTPYDISKSELIEAWNTQGQAFLDFSKYNSERYDAFHQLDIRVDKGFFFKKWSLMLYLDIQNFYNFKAKQQDYIVRSLDENGNYMTKDSNTKYVLKNLPNESGTVLPTIGIMFEF